MAINPRIFKQVRKALGLTQQELADELGISRVWVNRMEQGKLKRGIPDEIAAKLLALKTGAKPEKVNYAKEHELSVAFQEAGDDNHLWDNEEDD